LYPELGILGFQEGKSPALVREVGRLTALLPSYEAVQQELAERGLKLNIKEVHGIGQYAAQAALTFRKRELELYREGKLPTGDGRGKRFGAMIDGGRTKIRQAKRRQKGCGKSKTQKRRYQTDWREPKQLAPRQPAPGQRRPLPRRRFLGPAQCDAQTGTARLPRRERSRLSHVAASPPGRGAFSPGAGRARPHHGRLPQRAANQGPGARAGLNGAFC
jgi:hypothetical protein